MVNLDAVIQRGGMFFSLRHYAEAGARLLGHGHAEIEALIDPTFNIRFATIGDAEVLFLWRNDPLTRANSHNTDEVPWKNHVTWLASSLKAIRRTLLIAEVDGVPVGTVRLDNTPSNIVGISPTIEMSWTVAPEARGKGYAKRMVSAAASPGVVAEIKQDNIASQKVAAAAGFTLTQDGPLQKWKR